MKRKHSMPFGAECGDGRVRFRLWAPGAEEVGLSLGRDDAEASLPMTQQENGWFELLTDRAGAGSRYKFQIDGGIKVPDPGSRFQPLDVHGPSEVIDPTSFDWRDQDWRGRPWNEAAIYELHVGTFTPEGTFVAAEERLDYLVELGITAVELMPVADFPGARNWGYDSVLPFAPDSRYGRPDDLKRLIQTAHGKGLMVFLDVVYNHFGPEGNYLLAYAPQFFTDRYRTPWGKAINFDGADSRVVRDFFINNALYWLKEYHLDGLRLDAVHAMIDNSSPDILTELGEGVRLAAPEAHVHLVLENDDNRARYLRRDGEGSAKLYNAQWNDDIHHALHVALTGEKDGYYSDYGDCPIQHLGRCLAQGLDYQGQTSAFRGGAPRGEPSRDLPPTAFVSFLQNHDQIGNRAFGERIGKLADRRAVRAAMAIVLLAPSPPLLFMGEEFGADRPFLFFCDFGPELARRVTEGRRNEFSKFARFRQAAARAQIPDPSAESTFQRSKLDWKAVSEPQHREWLECYRNLLAVRRREIVPRIAKVKSGEAEYGVVDRTLTVYWHLDNGGELSLVSNLGDEVNSEVLRPAGELLFASDEAVGVRLERGMMPAWSVAWFLKA